MAVIERDAHQRVLITLMARLQYWTTDGEVVGTPAMIAFEDDKVAPDIFWVAPSNQRCQQLHDTGRHPGAASDLDDGGLGGSNDGDAKSPSAARVSARTPS